MMHGQKNIKLHYHLCLYEPVAVLT